MRDLVNLYFKGHNIVNHHVSSFNDFLATDDNPNSRMQRIVDDVSVQPDGIDHGIIRIDVDKDSRDGRHLIIRVGRNYPDYHVGVAITGGPFLTNPGTNGMNVGWRTSLPSGAAVDVRKSGTDAVFRVLRGDAGILSAHDLSHVVHLTRLEEGIWCWNRYKIRTFKDC